MGHHNIQQKQQHQQQVLLLYNLQYSIFFMRIYTVVDESIIDQIFLKQKYAGMMMKQFGFKILMIVFD